MHHALCPNLEIDHGPLLALYQKIKQLKMVRKAVVSSGVRYDMFFDPDGNLTTDGEQYARVLIDDHQDIARALGEQGQG